jgi:uroporphyrinogen decarboxylase
MSLPYFKQRVKNVKKYRDHLILHNCGNNIPLMNMFIEAGVDCYQSLQTTAGMDVAKLKSMFGDRMALWGGVAVEKLIDGTPDEIRKEVRKAMYNGSEGSGFILGPSHSIAKNIKYENFMAMLDEYNKLSDKV